MDNIYTRRSFQVEARQISFENIEEVAEWCGGKVEKRSMRMMGTSVLLPVISLKGTGVEHGNYYIGHLNCWIVKMGKSARIYKPEQFEKTFLKFSLESQIIEAIKLLTNNGYKVVSEEAQRLVREVNALGFVPLPIEGSLSSEVNTAIDQALQIAAHEVESRNTECEV
jgi:hypothetical protein